MKKERCKVAFLFKNGRKNRIASDKFPDEFMYGFNYLSTRGWDISLIEERDLNIDLAKSNKLSIICNHFFYRLFGIPLFVLLKLVNLKNIKLLNKYNAVLVTTTTFGICLSILHRIGLIKTRILYISMGLFDVDTPNHIVWIYRKILKKTYIFTLSEAERIKMTKFMGAGAKLIQFGVDQRFWVPKNNEIHDNYIISIGNDRHRDYQTLLLSWKPEYPNLIIITNHKLNEIPSNVKIIVGSWHSEILTDVEMRELIQNSRFVILPIKQTLQPSGQSVCLQSMACGKAVIITDYCGIWDRNLLKNESTCIFSGTPGSIEGIQKAVEKLLSNTNLASVIGKNARQIIIENLNSDVMSSQLEDYISSILTAT